MTTHTHTHQSPLPQSQFNDRRSKQQYCPRHCLETILDKCLTFVNEALCHTDLYHGGLVKGSQMQVNMLIVLGCIQKHNYIIKHSSVCHSG